MMARKHLSGSALPRTNLARFNGAAPMMARKLELFPHAPDVLKASMEPRQ